MPDIDPQVEAEKDIPRFVRRCWEQYQNATVDNRKASVESLKMWVGGELQWRPGEIANRTGNNRPWITINCLKTAVDQVENEARENPPGPQAHPVGGGADKDGADILEGLIREYEYRSNALYPGSGTVTGFYTVAGLFTSRNDAGFTMPGGTVDGNGTMNGMLVGAGYFHKIGSLFYDDGSQRWKMSNEISSVQNSIGHMVVSEPALSFTNSGSTAALGTCGGGTDLAWNAGGGVSSSTHTFVAGDVGGFIHTTAGTGWVAADYYISGVNGGQAVLSDSVTTNATGGIYTINRGRQVLVQGGAGVADTLWVCAQTSGGYAWKQIF